MGRGREGVSKQLLVVVALIVISFTVFVAFLPRDILAVIVVTTLLAISYFGGAVYLTTHADRIPDRLKHASLIWTVLFPVTTVVVVLANIWKDVPLTALLFTFALLFVFVYYWLVVPLALVQKLRQQNWTRPEKEWPPLTVLVPAYNEEQYVGRCLDAIAAADYPAAVDVVVVDDGSTDGTYVEALAHATPTTTVVKQPNGGKHAALNTGLELAETELLVSVDADSTIDPKALRSLVAEFDRHPTAGAIAGNVKVGNRGTFVTDLQALEYIVGINTFRRAFDLLGVVTVVPGSLGAFRREALLSVGGYSGETLTEDFDLTIEILKAGHTIHASEGVVYTEGPETWRDLYHQRLRWFRGNIQTLVKHVEVFSDSRFGLLHRLGFPYVFLSLSFLPLLGIVVFGLIVLSVVDGSAPLLLVIAAFFVLLQLLLSVLAIEIEGEDVRLAALAPFSILGFKQFLDVVLLKSLADVFLGNDLRWKNVRRARQRGSATRNASERSPER
ncbi:glycosyltransferase family 2 protein [Haloarcula nitratireducens]|uniref:Glycosyltransferase family 2 protein n=1 Tax=Haloarcula nitratireducens TaxID=2487749 RepID=A0AAW4PAV6_9EURY|nr:glycosyltransferase family 2 protein [Halomicroarcula nitratireducens]MBX0294888.1 glycosyltransferase family 2 protein [Halomicroarcula nitratireducens]